MSWIKDIKFELDKLDYSPKKIKKNSIHLSIIYLLISIWLIYINYFTSIAYILLFIAFILIVARAESPIIKNYYYYWMMFSLALGWFTSRIILTILFVGILAPIAVLAKTFNKDFLLLKKNSHRASYWIRKREKLTNYEKMY